MILYIMVTISSCQRWYETTTWCECEDKEINSTTKNYKDRPGEEIHVVKEHNLTKLLNYVWLYEFQGSTSGPSSHFVGGGRGDGGKEGNVI